MNRNKHVLIDWGGFSNKGAELMLCAVVEKLRSSRRSFIPVIGHIDGSISPYHQEHLGLKKNFYA